MRILLTGASSFTGLWFVRALVEQGHEVVSTFTRARDAYGDGTIGALRHDKVAKLCDCIYETSFGDARFLRLLESSAPFDRLCHHGALVGDYRSAEFDVLGAARANTLAVDAVVEKLAKRGCSGIVLTGSIFERNEGLGASQTEAVSAYGLSKSITFDLFCFYCARHGLPLAKFVIPNPFGPFEELRFTAYITQQWLAGRTATVRTPDYVRDNIHVELLAKVYASFATALTNGSPYRRLAPSGYVQTQGEFAARVAGQMRARLNVACALEFAEQTVFAEPRVRINTDGVDPLRFGFNSDLAWDAFAAYYLAQNELTRRGADDPPQVT